MTDDRTLPNNLEAERSILGGVLVQPDALDLVGDLTPGHFYRDAHQRIFAALLALRDAHVAIDLVTLKEQLSSTGQLDEVGGPAYLASLMDGTPRGMNVEHYATIVKDKAALRELIYTGNRMVTRAYAQEDAPADVVEAAWAELAGHSGTAARWPLFLDAEMAIAGWASQPVRSERTLPLGLLPTFDSIMRGGIEPGEAFFLLARPGSLKTMLLLNVLRGWLSRSEGESFVLIELEMPQRQLIERLARQILQTDGEALDAMRHEGRVDLAQLRIKLDGLALVDDVGLSLGDVERRVRLVQRTQPNRRLGAVLIDHVGLLRATAGGQSAYDKATETAIGVKQLARRLEVPVVAVVQANRMAAKGARDGSPPEMEHARDSGAYEENADFLLALSELQPPEGAGVPFVKARLAKNRRGRTWNCDIGFDEYSLRMSELSDRGEWVHVGA